MINRLLLSLDKRLTRPGKVDNKGSADKRVYIFRASKSST